MYINILYIQNIDDLGKKTISTHISYTCINSELYVYIFTLRNTQNLKRTLFTSKIIGNLLITKYVRLQLQCYRFS